MPLIAAAIFIFNNLNAQVKAVSIPAANLYSDTAVAKKPVGPKPPKPAVINGDIGVVLKSIGDSIDQKECANYFTVNYKMIAKNNTNAKIMFTIHTAISCDQPLNSPDATILKDTVVMLEANSSVPTSASANINYPYLLISSKGGISKQYIKTIVKINATVSGGTVPGADIPTILKDKHNANDSCELYINSPLPLSCIKMDPGAQNH